MGRELILGVGVDRPPRLRRLADIAPFDIGLDRLAYGDVGIQRRGSWPAGLEIKSLQRLGEGLLPGKDRSGDWSEQIYRLNQ